MGVLFPLLGFIPSFTGAVVIVFLSAMLPDTYILYETQRTLKKTGTGCQILPSIVWPILVKFTVWSSLGMKLMQSSFYKLVLDTELHCTQFVCPTKTYRCPPPPCQKKWWKPILNHHHNERMVVSDEGWWYIRKWYNDPTPPPPFYTKLNIIIKMKVWCTVEHSQPNSFPWSRCYWFPAW